MTVPPATGPRRQASGVDAARARRRRRSVIAIFVAAGGLAALVLVMTSSASRPTAPHRAPIPAVPAKVVARPPNRYGSELAPASARVHPHFKLSMRSGELFDVKTGRVLWQRQPSRDLAIASLTKLMTALVVVGRSRPADHVLITRAAVDFSGSGVGMLPRGKSVSLESLLYGLLLPSGNDAAIALAQHVAGTQARFVAMMNARAAEMNLRCTHFSTVSGIIDRGNYSCAHDLAVIAHAVVRQPVLAPIVATRTIVLPFPIQGGKLWLDNNNPLLVGRYPGTDGVKTGFTTIAGACLVATARRGERQLGVVVLHSDDPSDESQQLLNAGFAKRGT